MYLESHVRDHNHLLLTGQRRVGKTSIARELGRRLETDGWIFLFADVEGSTCAEDAIAAIDEGDLFHPFDRLPLRPQRQGVKRMLHDDADAKRVDEFLSWLRGAIQALGDQGPVFLVSGSC